MDNEQIFVDVDTIMLPLEDGTEEECAIVDQFEFEGASYLVLSPIVDDMIEDESFIYRYEEDGDDMILDYIEDEDDYERIAQAYADILNEE